MDEVVVESFKFVGVNQAGGEWGKGRELLAESESYFELFVHLGNFCKYWKMCQRSSSILTLIICLLLVIWMDKKS